MEHEMKTLFCGDAVVSTGFARCTHAVCDALHAAGHDVHVLGMNFGGDPAPYPYPIYPAYYPHKHGYDYFGVGRLPILTRQLRPDVIVLLNDPWNIRPYLDVLDNALPDDVPRPKVVGWLAVDAKNQRGDDLRGLDHLVVWTKFAGKELVKGGYGGDYDIVPLGVDHSLFKPYDREESRRRLLPPDVLPEGAFLVGSVGRNQPRKRLDLTIAYFADWIRTRGVDDAYLYLHVAPTGERSCDVRSLCRYYGLRGKVILAETGLIEGQAEALMPMVYSMMDVFVTTTQGEGFGLPIVEAMACGVPCIVPNWSGLGIDGWPGEAVVRVACTTTALSAPLNAAPFTVGGIADRKGFVEELQAMYSSSMHRGLYRKYGLEKSAEFSWERTGQMFVSILEQVVAAGEESAEDTGEREGVSDFSEPETEEVAL